MIIKIPNAEIELAVADEDSIIDSILVCPECGNIPLVKPGCASCGSHRIAPDILVHHYACGNVDFIHQYVINKENGSLTCPKCHKEGLIVNCDYDVTQGLQRCDDCGWTGNVAKMIGTCLKCQTTFLMDEAKSVDIKRYTLND